MTIHITDEKPDIYLTQAEYDRLQREYQNFCMFNAAPPSFEEYVRIQRKYRITDTARERS